MREVVLDTETTGLDPASGDRVVEIACLELLNYIPTGRDWHCYLNPERDMPEPAYYVHGLSTEFLADKPLFADRADDFLHFIEGARIIIHNAAFDVAFLNAELERIGRPPLIGDRVVDTLSLARRKHPGAAASLDALCRRYQIDLSVRSKHGALVDCELLAQVYVELTGRRQARLELAVGAQASRHSGSAAAILPPRPCKLPPRLTAAEAAAHAAFIASFGGDAVWSKFSNDPESPSES